MEPIIGEAPPPGHEWKTAGKWPLGAEFNQSGMWLLPTRRRLDKLRLFFQHARATGMTTPGRILVEEKELAELTDEYFALDLPNGWDVVGVPAEGMAAKVQYAYANGVCGDAFWIGVLTDDMTPMTILWDVILISQLNGWNIITSDDCDQAPKRMEGATVFSGDLINEIGYLAPPGLQHLFFDDVWEQLGAATGCLKWDMSVKVKHAPKTYSNQQDSTAKKIHTFWDADEMRYRDWQKKEFAGACTAVFKCAEAHGTKVERPDLTGVSLYVSTPSAEGAFDRRYVRALMQTAEMIRTAGGVIDHADMPYCADLSLARDRIIGAFLRSRHTHMLMIDDDIGWKPHDVLRLLATKLDFVGGAGPKKMYPLRFCIYAKDDNGNDMVGEYSEATQTLEVTGIGTGFLMITRAVAERMAQSYPELRFDPGEGQTEYGLFDPVITASRQRLSDDFAFCWRWRKIGGKVHVMPSIKLAHVGHHTFEGSLEEAMMGEVVPPEERRAPHPVGA